MTFVFVYSVELRAATSRNATELDVALSRYQDSLRDVVKALPSTTDVESELVTEIVVTQSKITISEKLVTSYKVTLSRLESVMSQKIQLLEAVLEGKTLSDTCNSIVLCFV